MRIQSRRLLPPSRRVEPPAPAGPPAAPPALSGLNFVVSETVDVAGSVSGSGVASVDAEREAAAASAPVVKKLLDCGATLVGKTSVQVRGFAR